MTPVMTLYEMSLLCYQKTTNRAGNGNLAGVINFWNDSSKSFFELVKSYIFLHDQYDLSTCQYDLLTWATNMIYN